MWISSDKKADYAVKVRGLDIDPYPIARGKPASFNIAATTGSMETLILLLNLLQTFESWIISCR